MTPDDKTKILAIYNEPSGTDTIAFAYVHTPIRYAVRSTHVTLSRRHASFFFVLMYGSIFVSYRPIDRQCAKLFPLASMTLDQSSSSSPLSSSASYFPKTTPRSARYSLPASPLAINLHKNRSLNDLVTIDDADDVDELDADEMEDGSTSSNLLKTIHRNAVRRRRRVGGVGVAGFQSQTPGPLQRRPHHQHRPAIGTSNASPMLLKSAPLKGRESTGEKDKEKEEQHEEQQEGGATASVAASGETSNVSNGNKEEGNNNDKNNKEINAANSKRASVNTNTSTSNDNDEPNEQQQQQQEEDEEDDYAAELVVHSSAETDADVDSTFKLLQREQIFIGMLEVRQYPKLYTHKAVENLRKAGIRYASALRSTLEQHTTAIDRQQAHTYINTCLSLSLLLLLCR